MYVRHYVFQSPTLRSKAAYHWYGFVDSLKAMGPVGALLHPVTVNLVLFVSLAVWWFVSMDGLPQPKAAQEFLDAQGFYEIQTSNKITFNAGCEWFEYYRTEFVATGSDGLVYSGVVCQGFNGRSRTLFD